MKPCINYLWILIFSFSCKQSPTPHPSDLEAANIKGNVAKLENIIHSANASACCPAAESNDCKQVIYFYNDKGNLAEYSTLNIDGEIIQTSKYEYNRSNRCSGINRFEGSKLVEKQLNTLSNGKLVRVKVFNRDGKLEKILKYDYSGAEVTGGVTLNASGEVVSSFVNSYVNGRLDARTDNDADGNIIKITRFTRNSNDDVIETFSSFPTTKTEQKFSYEYEYDARGNWIKKTQRQGVDIAGIIMRNITYTNPQAGL